MTKLLHLAGLLLSVSSAASVMAADSLTIVQQRAEARGYRVREVWLDPVLQQRWAVLQSVNHPELPLLAELTELSTVGPALAAGGNEVAGLKAPAATATGFQVRSGDRVILWSAEQNVRMQMSAIAEGNAAVGDRIQLRVTGAGVNGETGWRISGIVRGPASVEMER